MDQRGLGVDPGELDPRTLAEALRNLTAQGDLVRAQRASRAAVLATDLVADLVTVVANQPDVILADVLCLRLGTLLSEAEQAPMADRPGPSDMAQAMVAAAADAVAATVGDADAWRAPWRVLTAVADILPYSDRMAAVDAIARLRDTAGGQVLPATLPGPVVTGTVLWTRDRYGSRFAVAAPITMVDQPVRWYLWDIDVCGHLAFTVHSGFYPTPGAALAEWQVGVGDIAAAGTVLAPVDDPWLLAELMPIEDGLLRSGGESAAQFAEYHRSKRLSEAVKATQEEKTRPGGGLDKATAAVEFAAWLRDRDADRRELPNDLDEFATELADSWCISRVDAVFAACSPHRVALCVLHLREFYLDDFADQLMALLPDWTRWLAARNATPPELADRCLPYAEGQPHPQIKVDRAGPQYLARVIE